MTRLVKGNLTALGFEGAAAQTAATAATVTVENFMVVGELEGRSLIAGTGGLYIHCQGALVCTHHSVEEVRVECNIGCVTVMLKSTVQHVELGGTGSQ